QLRRSATGCPSKGAATRKAASLFTAGGPGAMLAFSGATPPAAKLLHHSRTVSSRTPNASAIRAKPLAHGPPPRDRANRLEPQGRRAVHRSSQPETSIFIHNGEGASWLLRSRGHRGREFSSNKSPLPRPLVGIRAGGPQQPWDDEPTNHTVVAL